MRIFPLLLSTLVFVTGCSVLQKNIQKPSAQVSGIELRALDFESASLVMLVDVKNPNALSLPLNGFDYSLDLINAPFLSGTNRQKQHLKARSTTRIEVPVNIPFVQMYDTLKGSLSATEVPYNFHVTVMLDLPVLGATPLKVSHKSMLPVPKLPTVQVASIGLKNITLSSVDLDIKLKLVNPNVFDVKMEQLNYELLVSGKSWAQSRQNKAVTAKAGQTQIVSVPVRVGFKQVGMSYYRQMMDEGAKFDYQIVGNSSIKAIHPLLGEVDVPLDLSGRMGVEK